MQKPLRIALCQINTTPGDVAGNADLIHEAAARAAGMGAQVAVFPELALVGYCPRDLLFRRQLLDEAEAALQDLAKRHPSITLIIGTIRDRRASKSRGRPLSNSAAICRGGEVIGWRDKTLLPEYDVFDEARYFEPASENTPIDLDGTLVGITICEDLWVEQMHREIPGYSADPAKDLVDQEAEVIVSLSASPYGMGKPLAREELVMRTADRLQVPVLVCNLWGGHDEVLFDGTSVAAQPGHGVVARAASFADDLLLVEVPTMSASERLPDLPSAAADDPGRIREMRAALVMGVRDYLEKCGFHQAVLGLSGGIDSALTACIAVEALGKDAVRGIAMPSEFSSEGSVADAKRQAELLGIRFDEIPIAPIYDAARSAALQVVGEGSFGVMEENLQARVRGDLLMAVSNREGLVLLTTGNKSELAVGYCTLYGDMCGGLAVIADLYKCDVYAMAQTYLDEDLLCKASLTKAPSAELRPDQKDSDSLPPYELLDRILRLHIEEGLEANEIHALIHAETSFLPEPDLIVRILHLVARNEYKRRQAPPGLRVSAKAFGIGRRIPIAAGTAALASNSFEPRANR